MRSVPLTAPVIEQSRVTVDRRRRRVGADVGDSTSLAAALSTSSILGRAGVLMSVVGENVPVRRMTWRDKRNGVSVN